MDKQKVLEKIKKCLALGESANEHEAAQAIRQAQILMKKYGISEMDVELSAVTEKGVPVAATLPTWHQVLISQCAKAFGVKSYKCTQWGLAEARFFGIGIKPELAAYAYEVLLRQLKKERREYIKTELKAVRLPRNKTARADQFCKVGYMPLRRKSKSLPPSRRKRRCSTITTNSSEKWGRPKNVTCTVARKPAECRIWLPE